jgi:hypothetical protein
MAKRTHGNAQKLVEALASATGLVVRHEIMKDLVEAKAPSKQAFLLIPATDHVEQADVIVVSTRSAAVDAMKEMVSKADAYRHVHTHPHSMHEDAVPAELDETFSVAA